MKGRGEKRKGEGREGLHRGSLVRYGHPSYSFFPINTSVPPLSVFHTQSILACSVVFYFLV
jgi:hypothetical protein